MGPWTPILIIKTLYYTRAVFFSWPTGPGGFRDPEIDHGPSDGYLKEAELPILFWGFLLRIIV